MVVVPYLVNNSSVRWGWVSRLSRTDGNNAYHLLVAVEDGELLLGQVDHKAQNEFNHAQAPALNIRRAAALLETRESR